MGKLLELVRTARAKGKLARGRCSECGRILPDTGAAFERNTCSDACANSAWERTW